MDRAQWAKRQVAELIDLGDDALDAEAFVAAVLALVPEGEDPSTYPLSADDIAALARVTNEAVQAARVEWYAADWVPARYKRLLDSRERVREYSDDQPRDETGKWTDAGGGLPAGISVDAFGNYGNPQVWRTVNRMTTRVTGDEARAILASPQAQRDITQQKAQRERERQERQQRQAAAIDASRKEQEERQKREAAEEAARQARAVATAANRQEAFANPHAPEGDDEAVPDGRRYLGIDSATGLAVTRYGTDELHDSDVAWGGFRERIAQDAVSQNQSPSIRVYGLEAQNGQLQAVASTESRTWGERPMVEVNFLASAGQTKGEGTSMIAYICQEAARDGRGVMLHAAISAEGFYEHLGMRVLDRRQTGTLSVYGFSTRQARAFGRAYYGS
jgi:hypothetical protein